MGQFLIVQYLLSGEHKNYDHVLNSNLQILSKFQVNNFHVTMQSVICFQVEIQQMGILSKYF